MLSPQGGHRIFYTPSPGPTDTEGTQEDQTTKGGSPGFRRYNNSLKSLC